MPLPAGYRCGLCGATDLDEGRKNCEPCEANALRISLLALYNHCIYLKGCLPPPHAPGHHQMARAKLLLEEQGMLP